MKPEIGSRLAPFLFAAAFVPLVPTASATVIWADDFENDTPGSAPSNNFPGGAGTQDWGISNGGTTSTTVASVGGGISLYQTDSTIDSSVASVSTTQFAPFSLNASTPLLKVTFDFRVDSYLVNGTTTANPRMILRSGGSTTSGNKGYILGFGRSSVDVDGDPSAADLHFFLSPHAATTSNTNGGSGTYVGLNGGAWDSGFDFGDYSLTSTDNNTDGNFYRFELIYDWLTGTINGTATNLGNTSQTTTFSIAIDANVSFQDASASLLFATGSNGGTGNPAGGDTYFDNIVVEVIPEPSTGVLALGAIGLCLVRRRK